MQYPGLIKIGSTNAAAVKAIKKKLNELIGSTLDVNSGVFGESTKAVVIQFQKSKSFLPDGTVGDLTWKRLFQVATDIRPVDYTKSLGMIVVQLLMTQLKVRELTGNNDGTDVEKYLKSVGLGKGYAWCMAFLYWGFSTVCATLMRGNPLFKTGGVLAQWNKQPDSVKIYKDPQPGDIYIMDFGKGAGHCGIVTNVIDSTRFHGLEGNTSADPSIPAEDRDGNGVFQRSRKTSSVNKGFIRFS